MGNRARKIAIIKQYLPQCNSVYKCHVYGEIPSSKIENACETYAGFVTEYDALGMIDETFFDTGRKGFLFTEDGFYMDSGTGLNKYSDGITFNSLPSSYNLAAMNEMLTKLTEADAAPSGWEIAADLLNVAAEWIQGAVDETPEETSAIGNSTEEDEEAGLMELVKNSLDYLNGLYAQILDALDAEDDDPDEFSKEAQGVLDTLEASGGSVEEALDEFFRQALADEEGAELPELAKATERCKDVLDEELPSVSFDEDSMEDCRRALRRFQKKVKFVRSCLKEIVKGPDE